MGGVEPGALFFHLENTMCIDPPHDSAPHSGLTAAWVGVDELAALLPSSPSNLITASYYECYDCYLESST